MRFLVESRLNVIPTPEILALIPAESQRGLELDRQGVREALYVAADQSAAWQVFQAASPADLDGILASFPLHPYSQHTITPLADTPAAASMS